MLPKDAAAGDYRTDLVFGTSSRRLTRGAALGAAAAADVIFSVASSNGFRFPSWLIYLLLAVAIAGLTIIGLRRIGLSVRIERR